MTKRTSSSHHKAAQHCKTLEEILRTRRARQTWQHLTAKLSTDDREAVARRLIAIANRENHCWKPQGKDKARQIADQSEDLARAIERTFWCYLPLEGCAEIRNLPKTLREYATRLKAATRKRTRQPNKFIESQQAILFLLDDPLHGRPGNFYPQVTVLVEAAFDAAGLRSEVNPDQLRKLHDRLSHR